MSLDFYDQYGDADDLAADLAADLYLAYLLDLADEHELGDPAEEPDRLWWAEQGHGPEQYAGPTPIEVLELAAPLTAEGVGR